MKRILVYPNHKRDHAYHWSQRVCRELKELGAQVWAPEEAADTLGVPAVSEQEKQRMDVAVVLGGDGTMMRGAHFLLGTEVPILGINLGTLGYLTEVEPADLSWALRQVLHGAYEVEPRLMLEAQVKPWQGQWSQTFYAVNDFVIHRNLMDGLLLVKTKVNQADLAQFRADGVIVATPCGSTAYNFSAGGPIMSPVADNMILTPLCSHSMLDRSIILMGSDRLEFQIGASGKRHKALLSEDGVGVLELGEGDEVRIKKSRYAFRMIKLLNRSFYEILQKKMRP